jgi:Ulp1 family protease
MESFYGPSLPYNLPSLPTDLQEDQVVQEDQKVKEVESVQYDNQDIDQNIKEALEDIQRMIVEEVLQEQDTSEVLYEEDLIDVPNEAYKTVQDIQEVVWPLKDSNPVVIRVVDFHSLNEGQCLTDTIVDFYLKYQERKYESMKPRLHFFSSFFFRKLVLIHQENATNGFKKIEGWMKDVNIFKCDYIFLPILLR